MMYTDDRAVQISRKKSIIVILLSTIGVQQTKNMVYDHW